jgi:hypothetical protein
MPISADQIVRVAHADVAMDMAFPRSVAHWHGEDEDKRPWHMRVGGCEPLLIGEHDRIVIEGNCTSRVSAPDGGIVHIHGDLLGAIDVSGHHELIITGDVGPEGLIEGSGFCHVFVGGKFSGVLQSTDMAKVWIDLDFDGTLRTGNPFSRVHIGGDYRGEIVPFDRASLLYLTVAGFAASFSLEKIASLGYTDFNASIASSDVPQGIYPLSGHLKKTPRGNSRSRWTVLNPIRER